MRATRCISIIEACSCYADKSIAVLSARCHFVQTGKVLPPTQVDVNLFGADQDNAKKALSWEACGRVV
jgi:hypothetical protein